MKNIISILFVFLVSCYPEGDKIRYPYQPEQPTMIYVNVYPMEDVEFDFVDMDKESNADYFNRYGIGVKFIKKQRQPLPDSVKYDSVLFLPKSNGYTNKNELDLYIIPSKYSYKSWMGWAMPYAQNAVVIDRAVLGTTVTHELGHLLNLRHYPEYMNIMFFMGWSDQRAEPKDFLEKQIDTIIQHLGGDIDNLNINSIIVN